MRRVIRLTENDLSRLVRRVIKESEQDQQMQAKMNSFNTLLASANIGPITTEMIDKLDTNDQSLTNDVLKMMKNISIPPQKDPEMINSQSERFLDNLCGRLGPQTSEDKLNKAVQNIIDFYQTAPEVDNSLKDTNPMKEGPVATIPILGMMVPPAVLFVIGGLALILIFRRIFRRRNGMGCKGNESWGGMVRRINGSQRMRRGL